MTLSRDLFRKAVLEIAEEGTGIITSHDLLEEAYKRVRIRGKKDWYNPQMISSIVSGLAKSGLVILDRKDRSHYRLTVP